MCAGVAALAGWMLLRLLQSVRLPPGWPAWRFAQTSLKRRPAATVLQIVALSLGLMALLLLTVVRHDLVAAWRQSSPPDAPNHFIINIQPDQRESVAQQLAQSGIADVDLAPMIRGRLLSVDGRDISSASYDEERAQRLVEREFNLSSLSQLPEHNTIVEGRWFAGAQPEASVEQGLANTLGLKLGDLLRFDVAGLRIDVKVTSLRKLDWGSMRVNFFVILNPAAAQDLPASYITAFHLPAAQQSLVNQLVRNFPNLTIVDVGSMVVQVQQVIDQVIAAVEFLFLFTLVSGVMVLAAAMLISQNERAHEDGLLRALGATRRELSRAQWVECLLVGAAAGVLAAGGASLVGWVLAHQIFEFEWQFSALVWIAGIAAGVICAFAGGWFHSGDLGVWHPDGYIALKDRSKDMIISGGSNIYPREIEDVLNLHAAVAECSVVGRPHPEWGEEVVAFIVARGGETLSPAELDRLCLDNIARFKRPKDYRFIEALPKNNYGKILKTELRKLL